MDIKNHNFRFNVEKEMDKKAWDIVHSDEVSNEFKLITKSHFKEKAFITEIPFSAKHARRRDNFVIEKNRTKISRCYKQLVDEIKEEL